MVVLSYLLLFLIIYFLVKGILFFLRIYRSIHNATRQFRDFEARQTHRSARAAGSSGGEQPYSTDGGNYSSGVETIHDTRTEDEINRKIFTGEEGEYVEFEEEK